MSIRIFLMSAAALAMAAPSVVLADPGQHRSGPHKAAKADKSNRNSKRVSTGDRYAGKACPPGLAKKYPGCIPPGQWKKGYRIPTGWSNYYIGYDRLPDYYRNRYEVNPGYRYLYRDDRVYVIDAITRSIIDVVLR